MQRWLELVSRDQGLRGLDITGFSHVDGRSLCRMRREDFLQLAGPYEADVLLTSLTYLRRGLFVCLFVSLLVRLAIFAKNIMTEF